VVLVRVNEVVGGELLEDKSSEAKKNYARGGSVVSENRPGTKYEKDKTTTFFAKG